MSANASRGDQILNAKSFEKQGFCEVIDEDTMTTDVLLDTIKNVYDNRADYIESMRVSGLSNGVDTIISLIKDVTFIIKIPNLKGFHPHEFAHTLVKCLLFEHHYK